MTAPGFTGPDDRPDPQVTYALDGLPMGEYDEDGVWWIVTKTEGWHDSVEVRDAVEDIPDGFGAYDGDSYAKARLVTVNATVVAPDARARNRARDRYNGLCSDPRRRYELRVTDQHREVRTALVKRNGRPRFELVNEHLAKAQLTLRAADPRKHDGFWQEPFSTVPAGGGPGLDFASSGGLDFSGAGLDFGIPEAPVVARVVNLGSAPAAPIFTLTGALARPVIVHLESGREILYRADVSYGETVTINCDTHPARGWPRHARQSSTRGDVSSLAPMVASWPVVDPFTTATFALRAAGGGALSGQLKVALRSAWW